MSTAILSGRGLAKVRPRPATEWRDLVDRDAFGAIGSEWNALVEASGPEPFYRHEYIRSFLHHFLPEAPIKVVTGRDSGGVLVAALPLVATRGSICGIRTRELTSPSNVHSLRFDLIAHSGETSAEAILSHLAEDRSWNVLKITDVPEGGKAWGLYRAARAAGFPAGAWESQRSPYLTLPRSPVLLREGLRGKFKANLRRRRKRLAELGEIVVHRLAGAELTERALRECFSLEQRGWKGRQGSAVNQSEAILGFHIELLENLEYRESLSLYQLRVGGQLIAFHYGITAHGVYSLVMTSYAERFKESSPGQLLTEDVLIDCISRGLKEFDFLGCDLPWKLEWTKTVRPHHWIFIFRNNGSGRLLWRIKFVWAKAARQLLTKGVSR